MSIAVSFVYATHVPHEELTILGTGIGFAVSIAHSLLVKLLMEYISAGNNS